MKTICLFLFHLFLSLSALSAGKVAIDTRDVLYERLNGVFSENLTGAGVLVAIIDSGVNFSHPLLRNNRWQGPRGLSGWNFYQNSPTTVDELGHGTAAAGMISSEIGIAPQSQIIDLQVTGKEGVSTTEALKKAIIYALKNDAQIINISMSVAPSLLKEIRQEVGSKHFSKALFVVAAGNFHEKHSKPHGLPNLLFVGASTLTEAGPLRKTSYTGYGPGVDVYAPAGEILGNFTLNNHWQQNFYRNFNGTSSAAPVIAGLAALEMQKHPRATAAEISAQIKKGLAKYQPL